MDNQQIEEAQTLESLGGEIRQGFGNADFNNRLVRYGKARDSAMQFCDYLRSVGEESLAWALNDCGNLAVFRDYFTIGEIRLSHFCTCKKHLICNLCAIRRGAKALRVYLCRVEHLIKANPKLRAYMVTFTVKNGDDLLERFKHLSSSLRGYHRRRSRSRQRGEILKASSAVWSYEFTNKGKGWHPHVHAVWLCEVPPDQFSISQEWKDITGDSFIVDARPLDMADPVAAFLEVFKYAVKFSDLADVDRLEAYHTLRKKRLLDSFGELRGLDVEPNDGDEILDELPYIERLYRYVRGFGFMALPETGEVKHG